MFASSKLFRIFFEDSLSSLSAKCYLFALGITQLFQNLHRSSQRLVGEMEMETKQIFRLEICPYTEFSTLCRSCRHLLRITTLEQDRAGEEEERISSFFLFPPAVISSPPSLSPIAFPSDIHLPPLSDSYLRRRLPRLPRSKRRMAPPFAVREYRKGAGGEGSEVESHS